MIETLTFHNYRCFSSHIIPLKPETVIVGRNNAGKSTVIEGFRLVEIITERYQNVTYHDVPDWLEIHRAKRGVRVDLSGLNLSWENLFHRYQPPPARVTAIFTDGYKIDIYLGPNRSIHAVIQSKSGRIISTKGQALSIELPHVSVLPQVMPLAKEEKILRRDYIIANFSSHLSPLHFRNQLNLSSNEYFDQFKEIVESTWTGLQIIELQGRGGMIGDPLALLVRDGDFVAEVAWMGHGLQMWLQTMWFITHTAGEETAVLDEPDVYMHPDLQRRLFRFMRGRYSQRVIATHSTEILSEADAANVLIVDRFRKQSSFTTDLPSVQKIIDHIGSAQNLQLARLWNSKRLILVEGKDLKFLRHFQDLLFPESKYPFDALPNMPIGGWGGWSYAVGSAMLLRNAIGEEILTYCILDADYYTEEAKQKRIEEAVSRNVQLHIWSKKEIENYLVVPQAIVRIIWTKRLAHIVGPTITEIVAKIEEIALSLKEETIDAIAQEIYNSDKLKGIASANKRARIKVDESWVTLDGRISIVSGKQMLSGLSGWSQERFGVSFGITTLLAEIKMNEVHQEIIQVIKAIENSSQIP